MKFQLTRYFVAGICATTFPLALTARAQSSAPAVDSTGPGALTMDKIFALARGEDDKIDGVQWLTPGTYTILEPATNGPGADLVRYAAATGARDVLVPAKAFVDPGTSNPINIESYTFSANRNLILIYTNSRRVWRQRNRGDYWVYDRTTHTITKLGGPDAKPSTLLFAKFSPDGSRVAYIREHNLYVETVAGAGPSHITQLTHDGSSTLFNGSFDWVYEEELNLRDGWRWSPDGQSIAFWQVDASGVRNYDLIDDTDSLYSYVVPVQYPKAGETNSASRVGVVSASGGNVTWINVPGDPRNNYIARMDWAASSSELLIQHLNRAQNTDELMLADAHSGAARTIFVDRDSAWVDINDDPYWINGGKSFVWVSEMDGWRHAFLISRDGKTRKLLTPGNFDIAQPGFPFGDPFISSIDSAHRTFYYLASPDNATQLYLYRSRLDGRGKPERVTPAKFTRGTHEYNISPDGQWAFHTYSEIDVPPTEELVRLPSHTFVRQLTDNTELKTALGQITRGKTEFTRLVGDSGVTYDAWIMTPPQFDSTKKYPSLFYVYGGPAEATVLDQWGGFNYLQHQEYAQRGYVVLSVDNRGTPAPRGRAWRKALFHAVGVLDSKDQAAAVKAFLTRPYADATRVGVWGWSNGGSMALNAMLRYPDLYTMGMSVAPVTDQRFYDTIYSERYMGLPQDNPDIYRLASPITFAQNLKGKLLLVHGSGDDNVHFQNSEAMINALVAADKEFTMMDYPNRTHCLCEGHNTYRHVHELLLRYLEQNLPAGPR